jgi:hypothetical protein
MPNFRAAFSGCHIMEKYSHSYSYPKIYCDVFGRMPPLLCNRKLDTPVVAMQPKVTHLHGYAHVTVLLCCIATNSGEVECFYWDSPIL